MKFNNYETERLFNRLKANTNNRYYLNKLSESNKDYAVDLVYYPRNENVGNLVKLDRDIFEEIKPIILAKLDMRINNDLELLAGLSHTIEYWKELIDDIQQALKILNVEV
jgi:hypothetical protein